MRDKWDRQETARNMVFHTTKSLNIRIFAKISIISVAIKHINVPRFLNKLLFYFSLKFLKTLLVFFIVVAMDCKFECEFCPGIICFNLVNYTRHCQGAKHLKNVERGA